MSSIRQFCTFKCWKYISIVRFIACKNISKCTLYRTTFYVKYIQIIMRLHWSITCKADAFNQRVIQHFKRKVFQEKKQGLRVGFKPKTIRSSTQNFNHYASPPLFLGSQSVFPEHCRPAKYNLCMNKLEAPVCCLMSDIMQWTTAV